MLVNRLQAWRQWGAKVAQQPRIRTLRRQLGVILVILAVLLLGGALVRSWQQIKPYISQMNWGFVLWGQLCTLVAFLLGGCMWVFVQRGFQWNVSWQTGFIVHFAANAAKYLPGYAWQYVSKAYLSRPAAQSGSQVGYAMATELVLLLSGGGLLAAAAGAITRAPGTVGEWLPLWLWWLIAILALATTVGWNQLILPMAGRRDNQQAGVQSKRDPDQSGAGQGWFYAAWVVGMLGWLLFAAACWLFARSLYPLTRNEFAHCVLALVGAGMVSLLVIIVPGGFGIREATMAGLLSGFMPFAIGVVVSLLMRLSVMLSEVIGLLLLFYCHKYWPPLLNDLYPFRGNPNNTSKEVL